MMVHYSHFINIGSSPLPPPSMYINLFCLSGATCCSKCHIINNRRMFKKKKDPPYPQVLGGIYSYYFTDLPGWADFPNQDTHSVPFCCLWRVLTFFFFSYLQGRKIFPTSAGGKHQSERSWMTNLAHPKGKEMGPKGTASPWLKSIVTGVQVI